MLSFIFTRTIFNLAKQLFATTSHLQWVVDADLVILRVERLLYEGFFEFDLLFSLLQADAVIKLLYFMVYIPSLFIKLPESCGKFIIIEQLNMF